MNEHERFMAIAIEEALMGVKEREQPFGACVVRDGEVICRTHSIKVKTFDATAHAETRAVGLATQALKSRILRGCTFYTVCEPCPMCFGAVLNTQVSTLVLGARHVNLRKISGKQMGYELYKRRAFDHHKYSVEALAELVGSDIRIVTGVLEKECEDLYRNSDIPIG